MQASNLKARISKASSFSFDDGYCIGRNTKVCFMEYRNTKLVSSTMFSCTIVDLLFFGLIDNYLYSVLFIISELELKAYNM